MSDLTTRIADVQRAHRWRGDWLGCTCGWNWPEERTHGCGEEDRIAAAYDAHVAAAVVAEVHPTITSVEGGKNAL